MIHQNIPNCSNATDHDLNTLSKVASRQLICKINILKKSNHFHSGFFKFLPGTSKLQPMGQIRCTSIMTLGMVVVKPSRPTLLLLCRALQQADASPHKLGGRAFWGGTWWKGCSTQLSAKTGGEDRRQEGFATAALQSLMLVCHGP